VERQRYGTRADLAVAVVNLRIGTVIAKASAQRAIAPCRA